MCGVQAIWRRAAHGIVTIVAAMLVPACGMSLHRDIHDPDPASKIPALVAASDRPTSDQLAALVAALDHDDAAVRMFALESLKRSTGQTFGYAPYAAPEDRRAAYDQWRRWLREQLDATASPTIGAEKQQEKTDGSGR